jgi:hypothetical protein
MKGIQIGKEEVQVIPICRPLDHIPKRSEKLHQKILDTIRCFSKFAGYKIKLQKSIAFLDINNGLIRNNIGKYIHLLWPQ